MPGAIRYLLVTPETTWGTFPGSPAREHLPVTEYSPLFKKETRQSKMYTGVFQQKHSKAFRGMPSGNLVTPIYGWKPGAGDTWMKTLLDWAFADHETQLLPSKSFEWSQGPDLANLRHSGMRVNGATLAGGAEQNQVTLSLDLMGKSEVADTTVGTLPAATVNLHELKDVEYDDCTFALNGSAIQLESFSLQVQHGLKVDYLNSSSPTVLIKTQRVVTLTMVPLLEDDAWHIRNEYAGGANGYNVVTAQIVLKGLHDGTGATGNWTVGTIDLAACHLTGYEQQGGMEDLLKQQLTFVCLKPDSSTKDLELTYSEAA
jgi:hypothetical protein